MLNCVFIINDSGDAVLSKELWNCGKKIAPANFGKLLKSNSYSLPPCLTFEGVHYVVISRDCVFLVVATDAEEISAFIAIEYLENLADVFRDFFGVLSEETLVSNIGLAYEIIAESVIAGFPSFTDAAKLKPLLCNAVALVNKSKSDWLNFVPDNIFGTAYSSREKRLAASEASNKPVLRSRDAETQEKGEVFVDLVEQLSVIIGHNGVLIHCGIEGQLHIKSYLKDDCNVEICFAKPNTTDLKLSEILESASYHPSVNRTEMSQSITTKAHPGLLRAMMYYVPNVDFDTSLPFTLYSNITPHLEDKMINLNLKIHCALPIRHPAVNLVGRIPIPGNVINVTGTSSLVNVDFKRDKDQTEFKFYSALFPGQSQHSINIKMFVSAWSPVMVYELSRVILQFEVPMACQSDLEIVMLKVTYANPSLIGNPVTKWLRYITHTNSYEFVLNDDWYPVHEEHDVGLRLSTN